LDWLLELALWRSFWSCSGVASGGIEAEDAEVAGGLADLGKSGFELRRRVGFYVDEKLIFPGAAMNGTAFNFEEIDAEAAERFERGEQCAGAVGEAQGDGHFVRVRSGQRGFGGGTQQDKASEILGVILDVVGENDAAVVFGGAAACDGGGCFITTGEDFADAAGGVFCGNAFEMRMGDEKTFALGESHGMRGNGTDGLESGAGAGDEAMLDGKNGFRNDREMAGEEQIVDADDGARQGIFDGGEESVGGAFLDGTKGGIKRRAGDRSDCRAKELEGGFFAEGAGLALEGDAHLHFSKVPSAHNLNGLGESVKLRRHGLGTGKARLAARNRAL